MAFKDQVICSYPTGSRYICNPPVTDTDRDTVILVNGKEDWVEMLRQEGWEDCGKDYANHPNFRAFRKGEDNYIVTEQEKFYNGYVLATLVSRRLNLLNKDQRIAVFEEIGWHYDTENVLGFTGLITDWDQKPHVPVLGALDF